MLITHGDPFDKPAKNEPPPIMAQFLRVYGVIQKLRARGNTWQEVLDTLSTEYDVTMSIRTLMKYTLREDRKRAEEAAAKPTR